ncbi:hypothetical protein GCM10023113_08030 [Cellulomonas oligotrophica]|uniref:DUF3060 domain-containing protein n=1 Tax=Cellulomonas oligotrophica TaxID=931536 RepID=A0ABQ4D626_9CELL|nr:hypothetical protein Col01nite_00770 [Cellulomonas oligotrophica]
MLALALTGCSVDLVDADDAPRPGGPTTGAPTTGATAGREVPGTSATVEAPEAMSTAVAPAPGAQRPSRPSPRSTRDVLLAGVQQQVTCGGGELVVAEAGAAVEVTDACGTLTVSGADAVVVAGDVGRLVVAGAGATVLVARADDVDLQAAGLTVRWEGGAPTVVDVGAGSSYGVVDDG